MMIHVLCLVFQKWEQDQNNALNKVLICVACVVLQGGEEEIKLVNDKLVGVCVIHVCVAGTKK